MVSLLILFNALRELRGRGDGSCRARFGVWVSSLQLGINPLSRGHNSTPCSPDQIRSRARWMASDKSTPEQALTSICYSTFTWDVSC